MIKYEGSIYTYNKNTVEEILQYLERDNAYRELYTYYDFDSCTKEKLEGLISLLKKFITEIKEEKGVLERKENEEESREYFGKNFIKEFNHLMTELDKSQVVVFIHGTELRKVESICQNGLEYKEPNIDATAIGQTMEYGVKEIDFQDYKDLLNWPHRNYKGLVLIGVPYECFYKKPLWNHVKDRETGNGDYHYKIDPEFIVGYLDVNNKKITLNPRYSRNHNYENLEDNKNIGWRKKENMDNATFALQCIKSKNLLSQNEKQVKSSSQEEQIEIDEYNPMNTSLIIADNLLRTFIHLERIDWLSKSEYNEVLRVINTEIKRITKILPFLRNTQEIQEEREKIISIHDIL